MTGMSKARKAQMQGREGGETCTNATHLFFSVRGHYTTQLHHPSIIPTHLTSHPIHHHSPQLYQTLKKLPVWLTLHGTLVSAVQR